MTRTLIPTRDSAKGDASFIFDAVYKKLGFVPNVVRLTSLSPNTLTALSAMQANLGDSFEVKLRTQVALAVSEANTCLYCLARHTYVGANFGKMYPRDLVFARQGLSTDSKLAAAGRFVRQLVNTRGHVEESEFLMIRRAGFSDDDVLAIIGLAVQYMFTNYINNVFDTKIDFPTVDLLKR